jgi:hypothetical protein
LQIDLHLLKRDRAYFELSLVEKDQNSSKRMVADMLLARQQIARETQGLEQGATVKQGLEGFNDQSVTANMQNLENAWHNLLASVGGPNGQNFVDVLQNITACVNAVGGVVAAHATAMKWLSEGVAALGAALMAAAPGLMIGNPIITAVGAVVGAATALIGLNWKPISDMFAAPSRPSSTRSPRYTTS